MYISAAAGAATCWAPAGTRPHGGSYARRCLDTDSNPLLACSSYMPSQSTAPSSLRTGWSALASSLLILVISVCRIPSVEAVEPKEFTLSNDMKVILVEVPKAPVATVQVWYKVGSRNEVMGRAGLSHMLEHMMFKGTAKYPKGLSPALIRKNGGMDNAFTSQDFTAYFENLAADRVDLALELEADRMQGLMLDANELKTEREVVKEERRLRTEDDPQGALVEAFSRRPI